ncbi:hypothetical protein [Gordonia neofelifaecis]|uniref:hypothetical protein n=1 Tax=Gordonia neofelifaecis TaxID=945692 RepID=UPI001111C041|nr:hypothetical protein [Gordonia neofelifaecis]
MAAALPIAVGAAGAACSSGPTDPVATRTVTETVDSSVASSTTSAPGDSGIVWPAKRGELACRNGQSEGSDVCVLKGQKISGDVEFTRFRVVKLIDSQMSGTVRITGVKEAVVTGTQIDGDLAVSSDGGAVVKTSRVGGSLAISGGQHATVVKNAVGGDLTCDVRRADGVGNSVGGQTTGACSRLRR